VICSRYDRLADADNLMAGRIVEEDECHPATVPGRASARHKPGTARPRWRRETQGHGGPGPQSGIGLSPAPGRLTAYVVVCSGSTCADHLDVPPILRPRPRQRAGAGATPNVIRHTDRNFSQWHTRGIRSTANEFVSTADRGAPGVRSFTSRSGRVCRARSRHGCAMPRCARQSHRAVQGSRSMR
jgi:hypothetical protein